MEVPDTFAFLLGRWTVERTIRDHRDGADGSFEGILTVAAEPAVPSAAAPVAGVPPTAVRRARYEERGRFRVGEHDGPAVRTLACVRREDGAVLVEFADGRPFVVCDLRAGACLAHHPCGEDDYELRFTVVSQQVLGEHWRVRGPAKDYEAWTTYRRTRVLAPLE